MPIEFIPTKADQARHPLLQRLIAEILDNSDRLGISDGVLYYGWPNYTDYDAVKHSVDLAIISRRSGVILIRTLSVVTPRNVQEVSDSVSQASASAIAQMVKSASLRDRRRQLKVQVTPIVFAPGYRGQPPGDAEVCESEPAILRTIEDIDRNDLSDAEYEEARSILEGAKAITRPTKRAIENPRTQRIAAALAQLEEEIATFDQRQRQVALTSLGCPQRIRGLAGSGKTVILAMKAAMAHLDDPSAYILVTFYTRSLRDHLSRLITRFHRHFGDGDPDWSRVHIRHGWGRKDLPGVYREACLRSNVSPLSYGNAQAGAQIGQDPFDYACRSLLQSGAVKPYYDLVLIDEGQDFPGGFYELCFACTKGERDNKQIIWAYDELQNVFNVTVRTPDELFGADADGEPRVSLPRALPPNAETNDFVLPKCYRNQRDVLVLAHAIGFGIYGQPVQMLQDRAHWEDVGYEVHAPDMEPGTRVRIVRPDRNSPTHLVAPQDVPLVEARGFDSIGGEVEYCAAQFEMFLRGGLQPEDLMAIAIDDRAAQSYISLLAAALSEKGIPVNNIIADRYSEPAFLIEGKSTLTTVYRAKGNEAAVVAVLGCDAVPLNTRSGRNRLFTGFTRTKGWLRITGMGRGFVPLSEEIDRAMRFAPEMRFVMPDPRQIETIQRDLSDRDARLQRAKAEMERMKDELGLTDDDLRSLMARRSRNGRR